MKHYWMRIESSGHIMECSGLTLMESLTAAKLYKKRGRKSDEKELKGCNKDREITHQLPLWAKQTCRDTDVQHLF